MKNLLLFAFLFIAIAIKAQLNVTISGSNNICQGNSTELTADVTGETGALSFVWSNGLGVLPSLTVTPATNTVYSVTVTDGNGSTASNEVVVTVYSLPVANAGADQAICFSLNTMGVPIGDQSSVGEAYFWTPTIGISNPNISNPMANPTVTTTYTLIAQSINGCTDSDEVIVTVNPLPVVDAGIDQTICQGDSINLGGSPTASGGSGVYTYYWNDNEAGSNISITPNVTENYSVTVTDGNGCSASDEVMVIVNNCFNLTVSDTISIDTTGTSIQNTIQLLTLDSCFLNYDLPLDSFKIANFTDNGDSILLNWFFYQNPDVYTIETSVAKSDLLNGNNLVYLPLHCSPDKSASENVFVAYFNYSVAGIDQKNMEKMLLYPNPVSNTLNISLPSNGCSIELYSIDAKKLIQQKINNTSASIDMSIYPQGVYVLKVVSGDGMMIEKVIKK